LNGSYDEDIEISKHNLNHYDIVSNVFEDDVNRLMNRIISSTSDIDQGILRSNFIDIISLYCKRRQLGYSSVLSVMLAPILACNMTKAQASSSFYSLASSFLPLINLQVKVMLSKVPRHFWPYFYCMIKSDVLLINMSLYSACSSGSGTTNCSCLASFGSYLPLPGIGSSFG
jgi:hypothetical protein